MSSIVRATQATYQALKALVHDRCWHRVAPDGGQPTPYIVYSDLSGDRLGLVKGYSGHNQVRMQVDIYGDESDVVQRLEEPVIQLLESMDFVCATLQASRGDYEPDTRLYRVSLDFLMWEKTR